MRTRQIEYHVHTKFINQKLFPCLVLWLLPQNEIEWAAAGRFDGRQQPTTRALQADACNER
ncbi:MAG: hypothetical protein DSM106950_12095 [Stigonema ocellatum SAG 48.90 = DSM 106950]|nr:hypothetical protein [Stigonema ocellatum SAG 48.90 = DSM 106950]